MSSFSFPEPLAGYRVHLVGAKGTGMCALAELLSHRGASVSGSDVEDRFYTDAILADMGIAVRPFSPDNVSLELDLVVHSAAYAPERHPELMRAAELGVRTLSYPEALGAFSRRRFSCGIAGVHGKTTTTALAGSLVKGMGIRATVLAGSAVTSFGGRSTLHNGDDFFIAETCEYRRHFLNFSPGLILLTGIEPDHQDYYPDYASIRDAFVEYILSLPRAGTLIYCADDPGARDALSIARESRPDIEAVPYGFEAQGPFRLSSYEVSGERAFFSLGISKERFALRVPGRHVALDAAGALALALFLASRERLGTPDEALLARAAAALEDFRGSRRRSEILGTARGILFMDDYAHHPSAIRTTLAGLREFYPKRRIVVDFMSHTYSRTKALFEEFAGAFSDADLVVCHKIYASAREAPDDSVSGQGLCQAIAAHGVATRYFEEPADAVPHVQAELRDGDLFLTMGAGDNWTVGKTIYDGLRGQQENR